MSGKGRTHLVEKVGEIKRMQANWMKERSLMLESGVREESCGENSNTRKGRDKVAKKSASTNKPDTLSWTSSSVPKKKPPAKTIAAQPSEKQKALRTRSASPARGSKPPATSGRKTSSRPSSSRSDISESSRPPSGRAGASSQHREKKSSLREEERDGPNRFNHGNGHWPHAKESGEAHISGIGNRSGQVLSRFNSDPNLSRLPGQDEWDDADDVLHHHRSFGKQETNSTHSCHLQESHSQGAPVDRTLPAGHPLREGGEVGQGPKPSALDPDAFDRLADQIAGRVKAEMNEEKQSLMTQIGYTSKSILLEEDDCEKSDRIEGHYCGKCKQLMVPPDHAPTMLVPCGHTFCEACSDDRIKCPTCRTRVTTTSLNSALQDVITASSRIPSHTTAAKHTPAFPNHHNGGGQRNSEYTPARYADHGPVHSNQGGDGPDHNHAWDESERTQVRDNKATRTQENSFDRRGGQNDFGNGGNPNTKGNSLPLRGEGGGRGGEKQSGASRRRVSPEEEARKMEEEFQSLGIRCEALESEEADVLERIEGQNSVISQHKQQISRIAEKQQGLREEIRGLEARLADLEGHRQEYKKQVEDAEDRKKEELDQLAMVRTMLRDMQRNRERVKMSARKLNLSLD